MQKQYAGCIVPGRFFKIFHFIFETMQQECDLVKTLHETERSKVSLLRHRKTGTRYILRCFSGSAEVYQALLPLKSNYLPQILEVAECDGQVLVLEEYIQGDNLAELLQCGTLSVRQTRRIGKQLCQALWVLHSLGAVHRDVKPENVILTGNDAVLIDFDAARINKPEHVEDTQILGTIGYAAPEQYGLGQTDARADIFAMGVLLNILLTGHHPTKQLAKGRMGRIVQRCIMTNQDKRFPTIQALMEAL